MAEHWPHGLLHATGKRGRAPRSHSSIPMSPFKHENQFSTLKHAPNIGWLIWSGRGRCVWYASKYGNRKSRSSIIWHHTDVHISARLKSSDLLNMPLPQTEQMITLIVYNPLCWLGLDKDETYCNCMSLVLADSRGRETHMMLWFNLKP